jgi:maleylacetate reductase
MKSFRHQSLPGRVLFGFGTLADLPSEAQALGLGRLLVLSTPAQADAAQRVVSLLGERAADAFTGARMHTPVEVTEQALAVAHDLRADGVVAIGGGSTTGLAKAIALRTDLPQIIIPTTYAGSEVTPILGETQNGRKTTQSTRKVLPEVVIYDVDLTFALPVGMSVTSGFNAMAHAAEALYAKDGSPVVDLLAQEGVRALMTALPRIAHDPLDALGRSDALYGCWLCGTCLGTVGMSLHHKLCHTLGGTFDLPHAETHTVILPHALGYNLSAAPGARERLSQAMSGGEPSRVLYELARQLGAPIALRDIGMPEDGLARAADLAVQHPYWNPRPVERDAITAMLRRAWAGEPPVIDQALS